MTGAASRIGQFLPPSGVVLVEGAAGASRQLPAAVRAAAGALGEIIFAGIFVPGVNRETWLTHPGARVETYFMTPELTRAPGRVHFLPLTYRDIRRRLASLPIAATLFSVSPPDDAGICSFGPTVDFLAELWPRIPVRLAHVNPALPRTRGSTGIPYAALQVVAEGPEPPLEIDDRADDAASLAIAANVAAFVDDGATLQTGLGRLPGAILRALQDRRRLAIHSGLIGDGVLDLLDSGAIGDGQDVVAGVAIGTKRLYAALPGSGIRFEPVAYTHDWPTIARQRHLVAINSAMEVDLYGQAHSERATGGWTSGVGGAVDFARGAALGGGLRIVALPATAGTASRIVPPGGGRGPVTLSRADVDIVVTEHGAADLRGLDHDARAAALVAVAAPGHREALSRAWRDAAAPR